MNLAFNDAAAIEYWGKQACNWGIETRKSKLIVMDVDTRDGKVGDDTLRKLELLNGDLPETLTVQTASGGKHYYFNAPPEMLTRKSAAFGKDVDAPNYVVAFGCTIKGGSAKYVIIKDAPIADAPSWFLEYLEADDAPGIAADQTPEVELDQDTNIQWCIDYLKNDAPPSVQGRNGEKALFDVAGVLKDRGVSQDKAVELLDTYYNDEPKCSPIWNVGDGPEADRLDVKVRNAYTYKKENARGSRTAEAEFSGDKPDDAAIIKYIEADEFRQFKLQRAKSSLKSSTATIPGIGHNSKGIVWLDADKVKPENLSFIWKERFARGTQSVIAGEGGGGKSQLMYSAMAIITTGGKWPDRTQAPKGWCIILSAEESAKTMIVPRLAAAGADRRLIRIVEAVNDGKSERKFNLLSDLDALKAKCKELASTKVDGKLWPVVMIGIDPASSYMGGDLDAHHNTKVRHVLDPLTKLAEDLDCVVISIAHFRKGSGNKAVHKVMDSVAFVNAPRSAFGVFTDEEDADGGMVFVIIKTNIGRGPGELPGFKFKKEFIITGLKDHRDGKPIKAPRIVWGEPTMTTGDQIAQMENARTTPALDEAIAFYREELVTARPVAEVKERERAEDIAPDTARKARRKLGIKARAIPGTMPAIWEYPALTAAASTASVGVEEVG